MPGGLDLFTWSLPFLVDKIGEMMDYLIKKNQIMTPKEISSIVKGPRASFTKAMEEMNKEK